MKVTPKLKMNKEEQKKSAMIQIHREPTYDHDMNEYNANFKFFFFFFHNVTFRNKWKFL